MDSTGTVASDFFIPKLRMNCLIVSGWIPRSFRDCKDQSLGSFQPRYVFDLTSCAPFDFEIFIPSIVKWPL